MVEDLSKYHRPIGRLLDCRSRAEDWDGYRLSEEQLEFFQENGYLKGIRILSDEQVEVLRGGPVRFWHDQLFCKPARHGGVVAWHQDYSYWTRTTPLAHLTCWLGLDDSTRQNGCLNYVPGSHKWPDLPKPVLAGGLEESRSSLPEELKDKFEPVAIELKKG